MIDTLQLYNYHEYDTDYLELIRKKVDVVKRDDIKNGYLNVYYHGMNFIFSKNYINIKGSISGSINQCNSQRIYFTEFVQRVEFLSDFLEIDLKKFNVKRIDLNFDLPVKYPIGIYQDCFAKIRNGNKFNRFENTIYCKAIDYNLRIYDKNKKSKFINSSSQESLRIEFSFKKNLRRQFFGKDFKSRGSKLVLGDIVKSSGYSKLFDRCIDLFNRIQLYNNDSVFQFTDAKSPKELRDIMVSEYVYEHGGSQFVLNTLDRLKSLDTFNCKRSYNKAEKMLLKQRTPQSQEDLVSEIISLFYSLIRYRL